MNFTLPVGAIVIPSVTALCIAHMHRKQMRQNEARRLDPTLPVKPPPSPIWRWMLKYLNVILAVLPVSNLIIHFFESGPITRMTIFSISTSVTVLWFLFKSQMDDMVERRLDRRIDRAIAHIVTLADALTPITKAVTEVVKAQERMSN